jgi:hypothetical protein
MNGGELLRAINAFNENLGPFWDLFVVAAYLIGLCFVVGGLFLLQRNAGQSGGYSAPVAMFIAGMALLSLESMLDAVSQSLFQQDAPRSLSTVSTGGGADAAFINFAVRVAQLVGLYGSIKGVVMLGHIGNGSGGSKYSAWVFIVGGCCCINIVNLSTALGNSVGGVLRDVITRLVGA